MGWGFTYDWDKGGIQTGWLLGEGDPERGPVLGEYVRCGQFYIVPFAGAFAVVSEAGGVADGVEALCDSLPEAGEAVRQLEVLYAAAEPEGEGG